MVKLNGISFILCRVDDSEGMASN